MQSLLADHFRKQRLARGLTLGKLAARVGYRNMSRGANRIHRFEQTGQIHRDLLGKIAVALGVENETVETLATEDRRRVLAEWGQWANEPIRPHLIVRLMSAVYVRCELPSGITTVEAAEEYAAHVARERGSRVCLVLSRKTSVWFSEDGSVTAVTEATPGSPNTPMMLIGGKACRLRLVERGLTLEQISWPRLGTEKTD